MKAGYDCWLNAISIQKWKLKIFSVPTVRLTEMRESHNEKMKLLYMRNVEKYQYENQLENEIRRQAEARKHRAKKNMTRQKAAKENGKAYRGSCISAISAKNPAGNDERRRPTAKLKKEMKTVFRRRAPRREENIGKWSYWRRKKNIRSKAEEAQSKSRLAETPQLKTQEGSKKKAAQKRGVSETHQ